MLSRLSISSRVLLLGIIPLLLLVLVLGAAFFSIQQKDKLFNKLYDDHLAILSYVMAVQQILQQSALQDIRKYRTGWASAEATEQAIKQQLAVAQQHWQAFIAARPSHADEAYYTELDSAFSKAAKHYEEWISYAGSDALLVRILNESTVNNEIELRIIGFTKLAEAFIQQQLAAGATVRDEAQYFTSMLVRGFVVSALGLFLLISLLIWRVQRSVCRPLWALRDLLQAVQQNSDLSLRANAQGSDEIAQAAQAIQQAHQQADHSVQLAQDTGQRFAQLASAVEGINSANQSICSATLQQQAVTDDIADNIHCLNDNISQLSNSAGIATGASEQLTQLANQLNADWQVFKV